MRNFEEYYKKMSENIYEKIEFIINEVKTGDYKLIVDFGCADGQTTRALATMFEKILIVGYDKNETVISNNIKNNNHNNIIYTTDLNGLNPRYFEEDFVSLCFMSSVTHEMFSFKTTNYFNFIFNNFNAIAIRDMFFTDTGLHSQLEFENYAYSPVLYIDDFERFKQSKKTYEDTNKNKTEFLLKQRYVSNFEEELKEDYFSTDWDLIIQSARDYHLIYDNQYMNSFLLNEIPKLKKFTHTTHRKIILKRRK